MLLFLEAACINRQTYTFLSDLVCDTAIFFLTFYTEFQSYVTHIFDGRDVTTELFLYDIRAMCVARTSRWSFCFVDVRHRSKSPREDHGESKGNVYS